MYLTTALLCTSPLFLGAFSALLFGRRGIPSTIPTGLLFHSVLPKPGLEMSHVSLRRFERFCSMLSERQFTSLTVSGTLSADSHSSSSGNRCMLTFDDGFQSVATIAAPVLQRYNLKATVFCLGNHFGTLSQWDIFSGNTHLTKQEIRTLFTMGHEIGSHSLTHAYLPFLDTKSVRTELADSKNMLEDIIGSAVTSLSFPYGGWTPAIWEIAQETGYTAATLYRGHSRAGRGLFPVYGVYQYDTPEDMLSKCTDRASFSLLRARSRMMAHFARGTPVWKYRRAYHS